MVNKNNIYITENDFERLAELLTILEKDNSKDNGSVEQLKKELQRATIISSGKISRDVVTMNSRVLLKDMITFEEFCYQIVFPADADLEAGKISVLAPIGTALFGYKIDDTIEWQVPAGTRKLKIIEMLYQPEWFFPPVWGLPELE